MPMPKKQIPITCEVCEKVFMLKPSLAKTRRFCSYECRKVHCDKKKIVKPCEHCGLEVETYKNNPAKYCSPGCATTARNLTDANPSYNRDISGKNNPMYGKRAVGPDNPMYGRIKEKSPSWKGGRKIRRDGYILVSAPSGHPHGISSGKNKSKYILEHRLVMEQHLGRYLQPTEVVHHIDENPSNNDISNLRLYSNQAEHISDAHSDAACVNGSRTQS